MLPKTRRLSHNDFASLPRRATLIHGEFFSVKVYQHTGLPSAGPQRGVLCAQPSKFAIVVSAKSAKRSVDRHLIKRRVMEAIQKLPIKEGVSCVFYAKVPAVKATYQALSAEIKILLQRATQAQR